MIVEDIDDDAGIFAIIAGKAALAFFDNGMGIGKRVDAAVKDNAFADIGGIVIIIASFDPVRHKVPDPDFVVVA
jgi:hypothetical protein